MSDLADKIATSNASKGYGSHERINQARNSFLSTQSSVMGTLEERRKAAEAQQQEEISGDEVIRMMNERTAGMNYHEAKQFRLANIDLLENTNDYKMLGKREQNTIRGNFLTQMSQEAYDRMSNLDPEDLNNKGLIESFANYKALRNGEDVNISGWDSFGKAFVRNSTTGGLALGLADITTERDLQDAYVGTAITEMEDLMIDVANYMKPEEAADWNRGKVWGTITGIGVDMAAVAAGGHALGFTRAGIALGTKAGQAATAAGRGMKTAKVIQTLTRAGVTNSLESVLFVGEEAIHRSMNNEMETNEDIERFVQQIPGTFAKGLALSLAGEAIFSGVGRAFGKTRSAAVNALESSNVATKTTKKGIKATKELMPTAVQEGTIAEQKRYSRILLNDLADETPWTRQTAQDRMAKYLDLGWDADEAANLVNMGRNAAFLKDPDRWLDEDLLFQDAIRMNWDADFEMTPDGAFKFSRLNGKALDAEQVINNDPVALQEFFKNNAEKSWNKHLDEVRIARGFFTETTEIDIKVPGSGTRKVQMSSSTGLKVFRPGDGITNESLVRGMIDSIAPDANLKIRVVDHNNFYKNLKPQDGFITVPKTVNSPKQADTFVKKFFEQMDEVATEGGKKLNYDAKGLRKLMMSTTNTRYNKSFLQKMGHSFEAVADEKGFKVLLDGEVMRTNGNKFRRFASEAEAIDMVGREVHATELGGIKGVQGELAYKGINIEAAGGKLNVTINGDDYKTFTSLNELLGDPTLRPGIPYSKRPTSFDINVVGDGISKPTYVNDGGIGASINKLKNSKTIAALSQEMSEYSYVRPNTYRVKNPQIEGVEVFTNGATTTLRVPESGFIKEFSSVKAAQDYMKDFQNRYGNVINRAHDIGMVIRPTSSGWAVGNDFKIAHFKTLNDAENFLARDTWTNLRELADPNITNEMTRVVDNALNSNVAIKKLQLEEQGFAKLAKAEANRDSKWFQGVKRWTQSTDNRIRRSGDVVGMKTFSKLQSSFRAMETANRLNMNRIQGMFKGFSDADRHFMGMIMQREVAPEGWAKAVPEINKALGRTGDLTPEMLAVMQKTREMFNQGGQLFGVSGEKWIHEYAPRMAGLKTDDALKALGADITDHTDTLQQIYSKHVAPQDVPFFMHARTAEVGTAMMETDLSKMLQGYYNIGTRTNYMKPAIDELRQYGKYVANNEGFSDNLVQMKQMMDSITGRVDDTAAANAAHSLNDIKRARRKKLFGADGLPKGARMEDMFGEAIEKNGGTYEQFVKQLEGIDATKSGSRLISAATNGALMAWNMRMPIRNISQMYTNLAPLVGFQYTNRALREVLSDKNLYKRLKKEAFDSGIITPDGVIGQVRNFTDLAEANVSIGMKLFKKSDELDRIVSMRAVELRTDTALIKAQKDIADGLFDPDTFLRDVSGDFLDENQQMRLLDMVAGKDTPTGVMNERGIKSLMQREITTMSMYDYSPHLRPEKARTQVGQIFGKMSTWPVSYFDLVRRGMKARPVEFTAKVIAAQAAVGILYNDFLDLNGVPYTPVGNLTYMGGPGLEGIPNVIGGITGAIGGVVKGQQSVPQAVGNIAKSARWTLPFYKQGVDLTRAIEDIQNNEYREGMLHIMGANPDYNMPGVAGVLGINLEPEQDGSMRSWWEAMTNWDD